MAIFIVVYLVAVALLALWTDRSLEYVLPLLVDHAVHVPYWVAVVVQMFLSPIAIPFDIIAELLRVVL